MYLKYFVTFLFLSAMLDCIHAACEDIQSLMDGTLREECNSTQKIRGGQVCVPLAAGPLLLETRALSAQPMMVRSFQGEPVDSRILLGFYPKWDKCFIIKRTTCAIKGATLDPSTNTVYWIELCPTKEGSGQNGVSLHRINLDGSGNVSTSLEERFENWFSLQMMIDRSSGKLNILTYNSVLECELDGRKCQSFDRPTEDTMLALTADSHPLSGNMLNPRG